jgi:RNA polymerase subunit RPABC4/transcription elongation factor Spt4
MNECPECGAVLTESHASCPSCGHNLSERTRTCDHCGETVAADSDACPACGHFTMPRTCARHPERDAPGQCALCGTAVCAECDHGDRHYHRCEEHGDVAIIEGWAELLAVPDTVEARLIEENLRAEGIDARILDQKDHSAFPVEFGDLARVRVLVPTYAYGDAHRVVMAHRDAAGEVSFGCPNCGEPYEEGETVCGACGEALV